MCGLSGAPETEEREVPVGRVFENFIGVSLNADSPIDVRLIYSPSSFQIGAFGSVIGVALTLLMGVFGRGARCSIAVLTPVARG
ncbi:MAG: hypothetical protein HND48_06045 [Chloroflexi bacterium]|nr:hypothetical protein [Chloroflexota bacterium]